MVHRDAQAIVVVKMVELKALFAWRFQLIVLTFDLHEGRYLRIRADFSADLVAESQCLIIFTYEVCA